MNRRMVVLVVATALTFGGSAAAQSVVLVPPPVPSVTVRSDMVAYDDQSRRHPIRGAAIGGLAGLVVGYIVVAVACAQSDCPPGPGLAVVPLGGLVGGALIGLIVGTLVKTDGK